MYLVFYLNASFWVFDPTLIQKEYIALRINEFDIVANLIEIKAQLYGTACSRPDGRSCEIMDDALSGSNLPKYCIVIAFLRLHRPAGSASVASFIMFVPSQHFANSFHRRFNAATVADDVAGDAVQGWQSILIANWVDMQRRKPSVQVHAYLQLPLDNWAKEAQIGGMWTLSPVWCRSNFSTPSWGLRAFAPVAYTIGPTAHVGLHVLLSKCHVKTSVCYSFNLLCQLAADTAHTQPIKQHRKSTETQN